MPKVYTQTARKEYKCGKCGGSILPGEPYKKLMGRYIATRYACAGCKFKRSETTSSDYLSQLYDLQDDFAIDDEVSVEDLIAELENLRDEQQEKLDNMPEQFQEADTGQLIQERIDSIEGAIDTLECLEWPNEDEVREQINDAEDSDEGIDELVKDELKRLTYEVINEAQEALYEIAE